MISCISTWPSLADGETWRSTTITGLLPKQYDLDDCALNRKNELTGDVRHESETPASGAEPCGIYLR